MLYQTDTLLVNAIDSLPFGRPLRQIITNPRRRPASIVDFAGRFAVSSLFTFTLPTTARVPEDVIMHRLDYSSLPAIKRLVADTAATTVAIVATRYLPDAPAWKGFLAYAGIKSLINFGELQTKTLWRNRPRNTLGRR